MAYEKTRSFVRQQIISDYFGVRKETIFSYLLASKKSIKRKENQQRRTETQFWTSVAVATQRPRPAHRVCGPVVAVYPLQHAVELGPMDLVAEEHVLSLRVSQLAAAVLHRSMRFDP